MSRIAIIGESAAWLGISAIAIIAVGYYVERTPVETANQLAGALWVIVWRMSFDLVRL